MGRRDIALIFILSLAQHIVESHVERISVYPSNLNDSIQLVEGGGKLQVENSFLVDADVILDEIEIQDFSPPVALKGLKVLFVSPKVNLGSTWKYVASKFDYYASIAGIHVRIDLNSAPTPSELGQISSMLSYLYGLPMSTGSVNKYADTSSDIFSDYFSLEKNIKAEQSLRHWASLDEDFFTALSTDAKVSTKPDAAPIFRYISKVRELAKLELVHGDTWQHGIAKHTFTFSSSSGKIQLRVREIFRTECAKCEFDQLIWKKASYLRYIPHLDTPIEAIEAHVPIEVSSRISGSGFHRTVELSNVGSSRVCEFLALQHLPPSAYIDLDEMRQLERFSEIKIHAFSKHIDVEKPASLSSEHVVFIAFSDLHGYPQSFPIHFRYQDPAENSLNVTALISSPVVWYRCSNDTPEWMLASQEIDKTIHEIAIPVGQSMARDIVSPVTLLVTVCGAIAIVLASYYSKPALSKSKFN